MERFSSRTNVFHLYCRSGVLLWQFYLLVVFEEFPDCINPNVLADSEKILLVKQGGVIKSFGCVPSLNNFWDVCMHAQGNFTLEFPLLV